MRKNKLIKTLIIVVALIAIIGLGLNAILKKVAAKIQYEKVSSIFDNAIDLRSDDVAEGYRFFWDYSLGSAAMVTVYVEGDQAQLIYKLAGERDYVPFAGDEIPITAEQLQQLRMIVSENRFWNESITKEFGLDGADWHIEVKQNGSYHTDYQWEPKSGSIRNLALCMLRMCPQEPEIHTLLNNLAQ